MKKTILAKVPSHARDDVIGAIIKKYAGNVFYDSATHSVVRLEEEVVEKTVEKVVETETVSEEKPKRKRKKK